MKRLRESTDAKAFKKEVREGDMIIHDTVKEVKSDLYRRGYNKNKMEMTHFPDWKPGNVTEEYRDNYDQIKWG